MTRTLMPAIDHAGGLCDQEREARMDESALIARYIEPDPLDLGPSEAQIVDHGVAVWALITHLAAVDGDVGRAAAAYDLEPEAVEAALRYYCRHQALIDARIVLNRSSANP